MNPDQNFQLRRADLRNGWHVLGITVLVLAVVASLYGGASYFFQSAALAIGFLIVGELNENKRRP